MNSPLKSAMRKMPESTIKPDFFGPISPFASSKKSVNFDIEQETKQIDLQNEIRHVLKQVKVELDSIVSNPSSNGPIFCYSPVRFSPEEKQAPKRVTDESIIQQQTSLNEDIKLKQYIRNYDIERIREQRVLQSFTFGRKLRYTEHCDERINTAIENKMSNDCCRRVSRLKSGNKNKNGSPAKHLDPLIFNSIDINTRTDEFYQTFANEMLLKDISKEKKQSLRKKKRKDKISFYKNIKKKSSDVNLSFDWTSSREIAEVVPIQEEKPKNKNGISKTPYYQILKQRYEIIAKKEEFRKIKRMIDPRTFSLSPQMVDKEILFIKYFLNKNLTNFKVFNIYIFIIYNSYIELYFIATIVNILLKVL